MAAIAVAALSSCTTSGHGLARLGARPLSVAWRSSGFTPVSSADVLGQIAAVYGTQGRQLYLYGLAVSSGKVLWRRPASTSAVTPGIGVSVSDVDGRFVIYGPARQSYSRMLVVDPASGDVVATAPAMRWTTAPADCGDRRHLICSSAVNAVTGADVAYRLDPATGELSVQPSGPGYREIGTELVDPLTRSPELISRRVHSRVVWTSRLATLFGPAVSTDSGWDFERYDRQTYAGTLHTGDRIVGRSRLVSDLASGLVSAGFRASDAALLWRQHGVSVNCLFHGSITDSGDEPVPIRCRYTGVITYHYPPQDSGGRTTVSSTGLSVALELFDPASGRTTWRLPLGDAPSMIEVDNGTVQLSDTQLLVRAQSGPEVIDLPEHAVHVPTMRDVFWCTSETQFAESPHKDPSSGGRDLRSGEVVTPCDLTGQPTDHVPVAVPSDVSAAAGHALRLVSTHRGVVAYRS